MLLFIIILLFHHHVVGITGLILLFTNPNPLTSGLQHISKSKSSQENKLSVARGNLLLDTNRFQPSLNNLILLII